MDISLEIVPRSAESIAQDALVCSSYSAVTMVNIPDLDRFPIRSWEACGIMNPAGRVFVPHLRAKDFSLKEPFPLTEFFRVLGIGKVLIISGDTDDDSEKGNLHRPWTSSPAVPFIKKLKIEMPELELYAAFDPYRTNIRYELDYIAAKEEAGATGFMSQPFFDLRLLEIYSEYMEGKQVFWGITPVLTAGSRNYWESRNRTIFPRSFKPDLFWNISFGRQVLDFCRKNHFNLYLMPVKVDLQTYLSGLF